MSGVLNLNSTWDLTYHDEFPDYYTQPGIQGRRFLPATVPASVHQVLLQAGWIEEPTLGLNSLKALGSRNSTGFIAARFTCQRKRWNRHRGWFSSVWT